MKQAHLICLCSNAWAVQTAAAQLCMQCGLDEAIWLRMPLRFGPLTLRGDRTTCLETPLREAASLPGPSSYAPRSPKLSGGRISHGASGTYVDAMLARTREIPAPTAYSPGGGVGSGSGKFSRSVVRGTLDEHIRRSRALPGPGDYSLSRPMSTRGGKISPCKIILNRTIRLEENMK